MAVVIEIPKKATKKQIDNLLKKVLPKNESKMAKHFGSLKRNIDAIEFQKAARNEWD